MFILGLVFGYLLSNILIIIGLWLFMNKTKMYDQAFQHGYDSAIREHKLS